MQGVGFHEGECVSDQMKNCTEIREIFSDYRNESSMEGLVELRETENTISWGWTTTGEWLGYTITVSTTRHQNASNGTVPRIIVRALNYNGGCLG